MLLLFDAANTLIHKPLLFKKAKETLSCFGINAETEALRQKHKIVSELVTFPDRTNKEFYHGFNREWLYALGIIPSEELLHSLYENCSYLPWEKFEDTAVLTELNIQMSVLSNFHRGLNELLEKLFPIQFQELVVSEKEQLRKPDVRFYEKAIEVLGVNANEIIYVGDSVQLDLEPALKTGMKAYLIDRYNDYPYCTPKLSSLYQLKEII